MLNNNFYFDLVIIFSTLLSLQGILSLYQLLYGLLHPENMQKNTIATLQVVAKTTFSIIIPCRHEEKVIGDTLKNILSMDYSERLVEILVSIGSDDTATIEAVKKVIALHPKRQLRIVLFDPSIAPRKSFNLNAALKLAQNEYIAVFDAEDEVHTRLLSYVNTLIQEEGNSIIQTGVSLRNWKSNWYSLHAVMEYYFWFHSRLHWYASQGIVPLGGVGIFIPTQVVMAMNGWDEDCLTEDAKLGFEAARRGYTFRVLSNEDIATREEVPTTLGSFVRQRTRWIQGFLQIAFSGQWSNLSVVKQLLFFTLFIFPVLQMLFYVWFGISWMYSSKLPIPIVLFSYLPLALLLFQFAVQLSGVVEMLMLRQEKMSIPFALLVYIVTYPFYQFILVFAALRALYRNLVGSTNWEKTQHFNMHRGGITVSI